MSRDSVLLEGVVGSTAYGLDTPESDIDMLGIYQASVEDMLGLHSREVMKMTKHTTDPDTTYHEALKFCRLALGGNPTVLELLWLDSYTTITSTGAALVEMRQNFLSAKRVRDAFLGFASQQFKRLEERGRFQGSLDTRRVKHARHLIRMTEQGVHLYATGELKIRVDDPARMHMQAALIANDGLGGIAVAKSIIANCESTMDRLVTPLPAVPNEEPIADWLRKLRVSG